MTTCQRIVVATRSKIPVHRDFVHQLASAVRTWQSSPHLLVGSLAYCSVQVVGFDPNQNHMQHLGTHTSMPEQGLPAENVW